MFRDFDFTRAIHTYGTLFDKFDIHFLTATNSQIVRNDSTRTNGRKNIHATNHFLRER